MPIQFACQTCNKMLRVPDGSEGLSCECPSCRTLLEIPSPAESPAAIEFDAASDALRLYCPQCGHQLACSERLLGSKGQCKHCKSIFTIAREPPSPGLSGVESVEWIFMCPRCDQLFEGKEEMRGRKGRCHTCGEVFAIELLLPFI